MTLHGHFLTIVATSSKYKREFRKFGLAYNRQVFKNVRKDRRKDKFSPGECMPVVLSMQVVWLVGVTVAIKKIKTLQFTICITVRRCLLLLNAVYLLE